MADKIFNIIIKLTKEGGADKQTVQGLIDIKNAMTTGLAVVGAVTTAYYAVDKVLKETVDHYVAASTEVEKFRNQTGMSAEDSSRLINVMNDLGISASDVETAFKTAEKNGFEPNIASLQAMKKQYDALNPGMERTQFLLKEFGKSGVSLQKFFEVGDLQGMLGSVNQGLIISDKDIAQANEYKAAINELTDATEAFKVGAGRAIIPWWTNLIEGLNLATKAQTEHNMSHAEMIHLVKMEKEPIDSATRSYMGMAEAAEKDAQQQGDLTGAIVDYKQELSAVASYGQAYMQFQANLVTAQKSVADAQTLVNIALKDADWLSYLKSQVEAATNADDLAAAQKAYDDALTNSVGLAGAKKKLWEAQQAVEDLQAAQDKQTASWMLNILTQQLGVNGLSQGEFAFLLQYQVDTGLLSQEAADRAKAEWDKAQSITAALASIPDETDKTVNTYFNEYYRTFYEPGSISSGGAAGGARILASGGLLGPTNVIGEQGWEAVVKRADGSYVAIPHEMSSWLAGQGLIGNAPALAGGGILGGNTGGGKIDLPKGDTGGGKIDLPKDIGGGSSGDDGDKRDQPRDNGNNGGAVTPPDLQVVVDNAVAPVVQTFTASSQANSQQVAMQTAAVQQASAQQNALLSSILNAIEGQAEQLAAEIQKRR